MRSARIPSASEVTDETMMPLSVAAEVAMKHGVLSSVSAKSLRREAERDRLAVYEVFGRLHTTLGDIRRMGKQCRVQRKEPVSTTAKRKTGGASETAEGMSAARASALASVQALKERCKNTSRRSTSLTSAEVIPLASSSRTP